MKKAFVRITENGHDRNGNRLYKIFAYCQTEEGSNKYEKLSREDMKKYFRGRINKDDSITRQAYRHEIENAWQKLTDEYETSYIYEEA